MVPNYARFFRSFWIVGLALVFNLLVPGVSRPQSPSMGEMLMHGGRPSAGGPGGFDGSVRPGNAKIMLHLMSTSTKNQCLRARIPATSAVVNSRDVPPASSGLYPRLFYAYVLVTSDDAAAGIAGVQFGIQYSGGGPADGVGLDVFGWTKCTDLEFITAPVWPGSGSGNLMTWVACQNVEPGGAGTGVVAVAGYFYCSAYTDDILSITPRPVDFSARVATCAAEIIEVTNGVPPPSRLGSAGFGALSGYNPAITDSVPPAAVSDLAITAATHTGITLVWTAPGDDGNTGTATGYDLRYSMASITPENFADADAAIGEPTPAVAGTVQGMTVGGLASSAGYYFAIRTVDDGLNVSALSNTPFGSTLADTVAPAAVANLAINGTSPTTVTLTWTAPGDDGSAGIAQSYDLRYSTALITEGNFSSATAALGEPSPAGAGTPQGMTVGGLASGTTYFFALKTTDDAANISGLSNVPSGMTPLPDLTPPAAVGDLAVTATTMTSVDLAWTAPGDDGSVGTAATYDLRYSSTPVTAGNFAAAIQVAGEPVPTGAGSIQGLTVGGLAPGSAYYFALKSADEVPNVSGLSNVAPGTTTPQPFIEVGGTSGTAGGGEGRGVAWGDYDSDGDLDFYVSYAGANRLYRNQGNGTFVDVGAATGTNDGGAGGGIAWADYDNDGDLDLYVVNIGADRLYRNDGGGAFTDVGAPSSANDPTQAQSIAWGDYDNDGDVDLYVGNFGSPNRLYRNEGTGSFTEVGASAGVNDGGNAHSVAWGDYDNDGDLDLYVGNSGTDRLYRNGGNGTFTQVGAAAGTDDDRNTHSVAWGDYDNDGDLDLSLANYGSGSRLYRNQGDGTFADAGAVLGGGASRGVAWGDYDNDGDLDLYMTEVGTNRLYRNEGGGIFAEVGAATFTDHAGVGQGAEWGDYDNDGDLDLYVVNEADGPNQLYRNDGAAPIFNHWLQVDLVGTASNRSGIGARVRCVAGGTSRIREVCGGSGRFSQGSLTAEFGLGTATLADTLEIRWPSGFRQTLVNQGVDQRITVTEGFFRDAGSGLTGVYNGSGSWGDYDTDGDLDVVFTGNSSSGIISRVYRNDGGVFVIATGLPGAHGSAWGDYDGDGDLDLLLASLPSRLYRNDAGAFYDTGVNFANVNESSVAWGDYDNDGDLDVLIMGNSIAGSVSIIYRNDSGDFVDAGAGLPGVLDGSAAWGDYDNDGDLDILLTGVPTGIYRNDAGNFTDAGAGLTPLAESSAAWGDFDSDGDLDILLTGFNGLVPASIVYRNDGGVFVDIVAGLEGVRHGSAVWGDYDNDGDPDVALAGESGLGRRSLLYRNDGGTFTGVISGLADVDYAVLAWGDYDVDGDLDLLLTGRDGVTEITRVYRNTATSPNSSPVAPSNLSVQFSGTRATFTWNAGSDAQTPASGLTYNLRIGTTSGGGQLSPAMATMATGYRNVVRLGNANHNLDWTIDLQSMLSTSTFHWSVQAIDHAFAGSPFAAEQVLTLGPDISSIPDIPNDQGGWVRIHLLRSPYDVASENELPVTGYNVWRRADDPGMTSLILNEGRPLSAELSESKDADHEPFFPTGLAVVEWRERRFAWLEDKTTNAPIFPPGIWEITGSFFAAQQPQYVYAAPTLADSTATETFRSVFMVSAHTTTPSIWFLSTPDSGVSVDNIAPGVPTGLSRVIRGAENQLAWNPSPEIDFQFFRVYRDTSPGFIPSPANLVHETSETGWTDIVSVDGLQHYRLSAVDHAGNESPAAIEISVSGIEDGVSARPFHLYPAVPNPFNPGTTIRFDTPAPADRLVLQIFDVRGRLVRTIVDAEMPAGGHAILWDGTDDNARAVETGVYFYRLRTAGYNRTMKMVKVD